MKMFYEWAGGIDTYATLQTLWGLDETPAQQHLRNLLFAIIDESIGRKPTYGSVSENLPLVLLDFQQNLEADSLFNLANQLSSIKNALGQVETKVDTANKGIAENALKIVDKEQLGRIVVDCVDGGVTSIVDSIGELQSAVEKEASNLTLVIKNANSDITEKVDSYSSITTNYLNESKRALTAVLDIVAAYKSTLSGLENLVVSEMKEWAANAKRIATEGADVEITLAGITEAVENLKQTLNTLGDLEGVVKQAYGVVGTYANFQKYIDQRFADINARQALSDVINSATTLLSRPQREPVKPVSVKF